MREHAPERPHWMMTLIVSVVAASITGGASSYVLVTNAIARLDAQGAEHGRRIENQQGQLNVLGERSRTQGEKVASVEGRYDDIRERLKTLETQNSMILQELRRR